MKRRRPTSKRRGEILRHLRIPDIDSRVESGLIFKADTLEEIATHFDMDPETLRHTIDLFNQGAETGTDAFGRAAEAMRAFGEGPYYALEAWPSVLNTQGGPERTARGEVLGANGSPIPHLYSADNAAHNGNDYQEAEHRRMHRIRQNIGRKRSRRERRCAR
ncbi:MAG: FAD-binding protein [Eggerthellaceae bacterium]